MKISPLYRAIAKVAPGFVANRLHSKAKLQALEALPDLAALAGDTSDFASGPRGSRFAPSPRDARSDTLPFLRMQRGQVRDLARTSPIAAGAINTNVDRVIGTGLALSCQPALRILGWSPDQGLEFKAKVQSEFSLWYDSVESDVEKTLVGTQQQELVLRSALESGDCFTLLPDGKRTPTMPYALRIQVLEADRVGNPGGKQDTPTMAGGVLLDAEGAPKAYHLYDVHPGGYLPGQGGGLYAGQWIDRVGPSGRRRMLHHYRKRRPGMPRGVPYLAPIIDCIKQISRYTDAEIMAAVVSACFTVFITTPTGNAAPIFDGAGPVVGDEIELGNGAVVGLAPGETPQFANPGRPNPNFDPFVQSILKLIGMGLSLPYELLIKQFNSSYTASKAALLDAWVYFRSVRAWMALSHCQPIFETWMTEAVAIARVPAPGYFADPLLRWAYTRAAWPGDSMGSIAPKDEVAAYVSAINARLMTRERAEWELWGTDFNDTFPTKQSEEERLKAADMLPVPQAGAAAAPKAEDKPEEPTPTEKAFASMATSMAAMAAREPVHTSAPVVNVTTPPVTVQAGDVHVTTPPVTLRAGDTHVNLPADAIRVENFIQSPEVHVEATLPQAPAPHVVVAHPVSATQTVERDPGTQEITKTVTTYQLSDLPLQPSARDAGVQI
jgi:lambda family phage portal protein